MIYTYTTVVNRKIVISLCVSASALSWKFRAREPPVVMLALILIAACTKHSSC